MASFRRAALSCIAGCAAAAASWLGTGPAAAFEVVKTGGPPARLLILGLGSAEKACGSVTLSAGDGTLRFDPEAAGCDAISQFVVIVRTPDVGADAFRGEWCEAIVARDGILRLDPTEGGADLAPPMVCTLGPPADAGDG